MYDTAFTDLVNAANAGVPRLGCDINIVSTFVDNYSTFIFDRGRSEPSGMETIIDRYRRAIQGQASRRSEQPVEERISYERGICVTIAPAQYERAMGIACAAAILGRDERPISKGNLEKVVQDLKQSGRYDEEVAKFRKGVVGLFGYILGKIFVPAPQSTRAEGVVDDLYHCRAVRVLNPHTIKGSQVSVQGSGLDAIKQSMVSKGFRVGYGTDQSTAQHFPAIVVIGGHTSIDNRRLKAAQELDLAVAAICYEQTDWVPSIQSKIRFKSEKPITWGEALELRVAQSGGSGGQHRFGIDETLRRGRAR